ncbi:MAG: M20 family metallopeptidase [Planctomycetota bacterium]
MIYGLHGWPDLEVGKVATRVGTVLAATDEFIIKVRGRGCHAAYPHLGVDPVVVAAHMVTALQSIASRRVAPTDNVVVTVGAIHAGTTFNVIPQSAELMGTVRTLTEQTRTFVEDELRLISSNVGAAFGASVDIEWIAGYPSTVNERRSTERFQRIAEEALGPERLAVKAHATMGGEDFSYYGQHCPASFFLLGLRPPDWHSYPNLHTPNFDFNDDALPTGVEMMSRLVIEND